MKVVVTGATGNLGTSTVEALARDPRVSEVLGVARRRPQEEPRSWTFAQADLSRDELTHSFHGAGVVVHLAWLIQPLRDVAQLERVNIGGTSRVLEAVARTQAKSLVVASSVGAYSPGPKDRVVDEEWDTRGISTCLYSRQKVEVERMLDQFEREHPKVRVVRVRPGLVFQEGAASEIRRLFLGRFVPRAFVKPGRIPLVPDIEGLRIQCVHSQDVGRAMALAALGDVRGGLNVAAGPVLDPKTLSETLSAPRLRLPAGLVRHGVQAAWHLRLTPIDRGWVDLALGVPLMSTQKARRELDFEPRHSATRALLELLKGMAVGQGKATGPLRPEQSTSTT